MSTVYALKAAVERNLASGKKEGKGGHTSGEHGGERDGARRSVMIVSRARGGLNRINQVTVHHCVFFDKSFLISLGEDCVRFLFCSRFTRNVIWSAIEYTRDLANYFY